MYSGVRLRVAAPGRAVDGVCVERAEESPLRGFLTLCFTHDTLALSHHAHNTHLYGSLGHYVPAAQLSRSHSDGPTKTAYAR